MKVDARLRAFTHILALLERGQSLTFLLTANDDPFTYELCFGISRHYHRLTALLNQLIDKKPKDSAVLVALLIGLYQLDVLKKPAYATVNETVKLLDNSRFAYAKGFVNAVLRRYLREALQNFANLKPIHISQHEASWLGDRLKADWPTLWHDIIRANDMHPPMHLRVNLARIDRKAYLASLEKEGIMADSHAYLASAVVLTNPVDVINLPGFREGEVSVQDVAAQCAVELLSLKPRLRVLDACAAPGGKTCHLLEKESSLEVIALDKDPKRLEYVHDNLKRLQLSADVKAGDGTKLTTWWDGEEFDRILLDAPCSATGVIRRHPDIRVLRSHEEVRQAASTQAELLRSLWTTLKPGGLLLYVTCSVLNQENDVQLAAFLQSEPTASLVKFRLPWGRRTEYGWQCLPGEAKGDGFYFSLVEKQEFSNKV
ncbi:MAG: hypothetical protein A3F18_06035 [Legionellales bacterium RIFCSPHIGHO2_12_FULL_37_14]|nr:MAG: hypothetical protein A3F18_06035 [Legionellales bacterium RIFCSPHIGHO2_12_FULL_37_14]